MNTRKLAVLLIAMVLVGAMVYANGTSEKAAGSSQPSGTVIWWSPNFNSPGDAAIAKAFEAANPGIHVEIQQTVGTGLENKVLVALQTGSGPDVVDISSPWTISFAKTGGLLVLDSYYAQSKIDTSDFYTGNWQEMQYNGHVYGLPYRAGSDGLIYNKKLFSDVGLDPNQAPVTWDDVVAYGQKLTTQVNGKKQFGWGLAGGGETNNFMAYFVPIVYNFGGEFFSKDLKQVTVDQPGAVAAATYYSELFTKYHIAQDSAVQDDGTTILPLFAQNVVSMYLTGVYAIPTIKQQAPDIQLGFGVWPTVKGKHPDTNLGGWNLVIPKAAKNPNAAWALVSFIGQPDNMAAFTPTFPARKSAMLNKRFSNPDFAAFIKNTEYGHLAPIQVANWPKMTSILQKNFQTILLGQNNPQQAMQNAAADMTKMNQ
jgi:multiple sugar transport system substrate-binding protein